MEERNLDFEIPLTREQWEQVGQTAARLGPKDWGLEWSEEERDRIHVYLRDEEAQSAGLWEDYLSDEGKYGRSEREVAQIVYNDGRPYAQVEAPVEAQEPVVTTPEKQAMQQGLERFVRDKWEVLMRESGLHYTRGHVPTDLPQPE